MQSIVIINVFFGKYPNYFPLWLSSAGANTTVDYLLVSDQSLGNLPSNIKTVKMTMDDFSSLATKKIGMDIHLSHPYKLCDLKVAYGLIMEDYIKGYDYWAHCDADVIWGDLRKFITEDLLLKNDRILLWGHLSLYRNREDVNKRFMLEGCLRGDYKTVFKSDKSFAFDETTGITSIYNKNGFTQYDGSFVAGIDTKYKRYKLVGQNKNYRYQVFYYEDGHVFRTYYVGGDIATDEFAYIHLHKRTFDDNCIVDSKETSYYISPSGFFKKDRNCIINKKTIGKNNRYRGRLFEFAERKLFRLSEIMAAYKEREVVAKKRYKYIHIYFQHDYKHMPALVQLLKTETDSFDEHLFVTRHIDVKNYYWAYDNFIYDCRAYNTIINYYGRDAKYVFLHSFFEPRHKIFLVKKKIRRKIIWRTWGHDLKPLINCRTGPMAIIGHMLNRWFSRTIRSFYGVGVGSLCDEILLEKYFGKVKAFPLHYISCAENGAIIRSIINESETTSASRRTINIMVGHSGLSYLNHIVIIDRLRKYLDEDVKVFLPMAYGSRDYIEEVVKHVKEINTDKIQVLRDFIPYKDYLRFLYTMDICVFDQTVSAALGNIKMLAYFGKKIYLNRDGIIREEFDRYGIEYGITDDIGIIPFERFAERIKKPETAKQAYNDLVDEGLQLKCWNMIIDS